MGMYARRAVRAAAAALLGLQGLHVGEHVLQTVQKFAWGVEPAHGLLGAQFDFEWVHFGSNAMLWMGLMGLLVVLGLDAAFWRTPAWIRATFVGATILEGYHVFEHGVRVRHLLATGAEDPTGILGGVTDLVVLHLSVNLVVYAAMVPLLVRVLVGSEFRPARAVGPAPIAATLPAVARVARATRPAPLAARRTGVVVAP